MKGKRYSRSASEERGNSRGSISLTLDLGKSTTDLLQSHAELIRCKKRIMPHRKEAVHRDKGGLIGKVDAKKASPESGRGRGAQI